MPVSSQLGSVAVPQPKRNATAPSSRAHEPACVSLNDMLVCGSPMGLSVLEACGCASTCGKEYLARCDRVVGRS